MRVRVRNRAAARAPQLASCLTSHEVLPGAFDNVSTCILLRRNCGKRSGQRLLPQSHAGHLDWPRFPQTVNATGC